MRSRDWSSDVCSSDLVFLAPETNGDFEGIVSSVQGRPGAFVRATQDLNQATLDRSRLDHYLAAVYVLNYGDPAKLKAVAPLLARDHQIGRASCRESVGQDV